MLIDNFEYIESDFLNLETIKHVSTVFDGYSLQKHKKIVGKFGSYLRVILVLLYKRILYLL